MKSNKYIFLAIIVSLIAMLLGCNMGGENEEAYIQINLGSGSATAASITGPAMATNIGDDAPFDFMAYDIIVTAPDMEKIAMVYPGTTNLIALAVPAGNDRQIELIAHVEPDDPNIFLGYSGRAVTDLQAGETKEITIKMELSTTKYLLPDWMNKRMVTINDMDGTAWKNINFTYTEPISGANPDIKPFDIDFDSAGNIYISNYYNYSDNPANSCIIGRISNTDDQTMEILVNINGLVNMGISIAVDRVNDYLYFFNPSVDFPSVAADQIGLWRKKINPDGALEYLELEYNFELSNIGADYEIRGISTDKDGIVYFSNTPFGENYIAKLNPNLNLGLRLIDYADTYLDGDANPDLNGTQDVLIKDGYLYIANSDAEDNYKIIRLNKNLDYEGSFGIEADPSAPLNNNPSEFYYPQRFISVLNNKLNIIDEGFNFDTPSEIDRIIQIDNINGYGWNVYGTNGTGIGQFNFTGNFQPM